MKFFLFIILLFTGACSVPILESPECVESRGLVREFYSFHFGNDMHFSIQNLNARRRFLSPKFASSLENANTEDDVFTVNSLDLPRAFRVGECEVVGPDRTTFQVLFFWRDKNRTEQRSIRVSAARIDGAWLIDGIEN
ncbi:MAG TPA: hypothetical protein DEA22_09815 [Blastocatellia bacterium]|nr:hypothetical protein [Blastocatellia bacterium]